MVRLECHRREIHTQSENKNKEASTDSKVTKRKTERAIVFSSLNRRCYFYTGIAGVGKDTVAVEVVNQAEVREMGGLQAWLQASSETILQQQLVDLFATHRSWVIAGVENDVPGCLAAIKKWLAGSDDWLLVFEDASPVSTTVWDILPTATGRVLVTSQAPLHDTHTEFESIQLHEFSTRDSISLLLKGSIFIKKPVQATDPPPLDDATLQLRCAEAAVDFIPPPAKEKPNESVKRRRNMTELLRPGFRLFLEEHLGNLPLSVALTGHMMRTDPNIRGTQRLMELFKQDVRVADLDFDGRNPMTDRHLFGLVRSVVITLDRLESNATFSENERREAKALLVAMSLLDRTKTPFGLLLGHDLDLLALQIDSCGKSMFAAAVRHLLLLPPIVNQSHTPPPPPPPPPFLTNHVPNHTPPTNIDQPHPLPIIDPPSLPVVDQ
jgi:hypothetical protein